MDIAYFAVTSLAALMNGFAAFMNFIGADFVKGVAGKVRVSQKWMVPFGTLLAAGAVGLVAGFAVPALSVQPRSVSLRTSSVPRARTFECATAALAAPSPFSYSPWPPWSPTSAIASTGETSREENDCEWMRATG